MSSQIRKSKICSLRIGQLCISFGMHNTAHGGKLEIKSELGKYTRAEITLPMVV
ncbi:MAG: ATP-binding protein [Ruminiclostridium sp.]|nr:ATP-binding protein [Ruminiclostridium sp.]